VAIITYCWATGVPGETSFLLLEFWRYKMTPAIITMMTSQVTLTSASVQWEGQAYTFDSYPQTFSAGDYVVFTFVWSNNNQGFTSSHITQVISADSRLQILETRWAVCGTNQVIYNTPITNPCPGGGYFDIGSQLGSYQNYLSLYANLPANVPNNANGVISVVLQSPNYQYSGPLVLIIS
jgi:hypothetical protein